MVVNGLNWRLGILIFAIFSVFVMKTGVFSQFRPIFGSFLKFWDIINPLTTKDFRFLSNFFSKNDVLRIGFWLDLELG